MSVGAFICGCGGISLTEAELGFFRASQPWGLILFKRNCESREQIRALTQQFRATVGRKDAPVLIDQEGGRVQRLGPPGWRRYPAARAYGALYRSDPLGALRAASFAGRLIAADLEEVGVSVDCLPVLDIPQPGSHDIIGDRAYSSDIAVASLLARAMMEGMMAGGVLPVVKHIPGHGRAAADSHLSLPVVTASLTELRLTDFPPFAALADAPMAMTAHVVYSAIDPAHAATQSRTVVRTIIRGEIGFDGLLMSDDLSMRALSGTLAERTRASISAGCDVALHCNGAMEEMREVAAAAGALRGKAAQRARRALRGRARPAKFDRDLALAALDRVDGLQSVDA